MTPPPRVRAQRLQPRQSEWRPVPIPQPAEALHTSDPETPTLRELAARGQTAPLAAAAEGAPAAPAPDGVAAAAPPTAQVDRKSVV